MTDRDWQMLTAPELGDMLRDIKDWMLPPYTEKDIEQWGESQEKRRSQDDSVRL